MKKGIIAILIIAIIGGILYVTNKPFDTSDVSKENEKPKEKPYVYEASLYNLWQDEAKSEGSQKNSIVVANETGEKVLENTKSGYALTLPEQNDWKIDDHVSKEYVRLFSKTHRVDITKQDTRDVWLFSNQFIEKTMDAIESSIIDKKQMPIGSYDVKVVDYKREKLEGIVDDLNYYSYYFVTNDRDVVVFQLKTNEKEFETKKEEVEGIIATLTFTEVEEEIEESHIMTPYAYKNNSIEIPENKFAMGVYLENTYDIQQLEKKLMVPFGAQLFYKSMTADYDYYVEDLINEGKIPVVTFLFEEVGKEEPIIEDLLSGKYDKNMIRWATKTKELKQDVLYRIGNEMNGDWSKWSHSHIYNDPDIYKMAYRHVVALFKTEGANNAKFIWNPNNNASPNYTWNQQEMYYPGDEFVDWVGLTAYNWGKTNWQEFQYFDDLYEPLYRRYEQNHPEKPFMIAEFSSDEQGGDKARFIEEAFEKIGSKYPKIKIAIWFSHDHGDNYLTIGSSKESLEAFKKGVLSDHVVHKIYK